MGLAGLVGLAVVRVQAARTAPGVPVVQTGPGVDPVTTAHAEADAQEASVMGAGHPGGIGHNGASKTPLTGLCSLPSNQTFRRRCSIGRLVGNLAASEKMMPNLLPNTL